MNNLSAKPQIMKRVNSALIKDSLKNNGSATKAEISEITGISITTIRTLIEELLLKKEIISLGFDDSSGGRRAERYSLNLDYNNALSFYIKDDYINYAITNLLGNIIEENKVKIYSEFNEKIIEDFIDNVVIESFIYNIVKDRDIKAIGIGVPGVVENGTFFSGKGLNDWRKFELGDYIQKKLGIPVVLENDLNSMALGFSLNYSQSIEVLDIEKLNLVYIHFTEAGVGAGIIANGQLIRGGNNFAGELGFLPINGMGHLEKVLDNNIDDDTYVDIISQTIAILNCVTNPSFIVIGGETLRKNLIEKIRNTCEKYLANNIKPTILLSEDSERDYLTGIAYITSEFMYSDIKITKN